MDDCDLYVHRHWPRTQTRSAEELIRYKAHFAGGGNHYPIVIDMLKGLIHCEVDCPHNLLSIGCGLGINLLEFAGWGLTTVGLDTVPDFAFNVNYLGTWFGLPLTALVADGCKLPFKSRSFDVVLAESVFEHLYDLEGAIHEQARILRPGGVMIILDGNILNPKTLLDLLILYPFRTRGRRGGIDWMLNRNKLRPLGEGMLHGRDEDIHSARWWRRKLGACPELELLKVTTTADYVYPKLPPFLRQFVGMNLVVARRI